MDNQDLSRQIGQFFEALASLSDENKDKLADYFRYLLRSQQSGDKKERTTEGEEDKQPESTAENRPVREARCSFCGKSEHQVFRMIQGPGVRICDECVDLCYQLVRESADNEDAVEASAEESETVRMRDTEKPEA